MHVVVRHRLRILPCLALAAAIACSDDDDPVAPTGTQLAGQWTFSESYADAALGMSCVNQGTATITHSGTTFSGTAVQTGSCTTPTGSIDNSGSFQLQAGQITGTTATWNDNGAPPCAYTGTISGAPTANRVEGTVSCVGTSAGVTYNLQGTWQMVR